MERIAALVEGHTEYHFMSSSYPKVIVQRCIPNGHTVPLDLIVESIVDRIEILGGEITKVVILLDREGRDESSNHIADEIRQKVKASGCSRDLYIGISDREIENWILSDETFVSAKYELEGYSYSGDGTNGKGLLKNIHGSEQSPIDKARALKATSPAFARMLSPSLASFVDQIDFAWHWAES